MSTQALDLPRDREPTLVDLVRFLGRNMRLILIGLAVGVAAAAAAWVLSTPIYRAQIDLAPASAVNNTTTGGLSDAGAGAIRVLGLGVPSQHQGEVARIFAALQSKRFLDEFIARRALAAELTGEGSPVMQVRRAITLPDPRDPVLTLTISSSDPAMAANLANWLVEDLNAYLREKALIETRSMLAYLNEKLPVTTDQDLRVALVQLMKGQMQIEMLITAREEYVLSVIDPAYPPGRPSWPRPLFLLVGGAFVGALLGLLVAALAGLWGKVKAEEKGHSPLDAA